MDGTLGRASDMARDMPEPAGLHVWGHHRCSGTTVVPKLFVFTA
jgi:hypothetical protein